MKVMISGREIGAGCPPYVIAEMSANHNGSLERALHILRAAVGAGADAVKLQTYTADTLTIDSDEADFLIKGGPWANRTLYDLYDEAHTPWEWHRTLFDAGRELGVAVFSSPFDETAVDFLEELNAPAYKIASFEAVHIPLLKRVGRTGKPVILSTGMATKEEIREAIDALRQSGCRELILLHCTSAYPTPHDEANLRTIPGLQKQFGVPVGLSDHTLDSAVAVAAVAIGAVAIEKHFTLSRSEPGPDSAFSLEPDEFTTLTRQVRVAWEALGADDDRQSASEAGSMVFRRSIYAVQRIGKGEVFSPQNIRVIRPGFGLAPRHYEELLGRRARDDIARGTAMDWRLVE